MRGEGVVDVEDAAVVVGCGGGVGVGAGGGDGALQVVVDAGAAARHRVAARHLPSPAFAAAAAAEEEPGRFGGARRLLVLLLQLLVQLDGGVDGFLFRFLGFRLAVVLVGVPERVLSADSESLMKGLILYIWCVCACVRACVRACVCV